jgi:hypothetical protein
MEEELRVERDSFGKMQRVQNLQQKVMESQEELKAARATIEGVKGQLGESESAGADGRKEIEEHQRIIGELRMSVKEEQRMGREAQSRAEAEKVSVQQAMEEQREQSKKRACECAEAAEQQRRESDAAHKTQLDEAYSTVEQLQQQGQAAGETWQQQLQQQQEAAEEQQRQHGEDKERWAEERLVWAKERESFVEALAKSQDGEEQLRQVLAAAKAAAKDAMEQAKQQTEEERGKWQQECAVMEQARELAQGQIRELEQAKTALEQQQLAARETTKQQLQVRDEKITTMEGQISQQTTRVTLQEMNLVEQSEVFDGLKQRLADLEKRELVHAQKDVMLRNMQRSVATMVDVAEGKYEHDREQHAQVTLNDNKQPLSARLSEEDQLERQQRALASLQRMASDATASTPCRFAQESFVAESSPDRTFMTSQEHPITLRMLEEPGGTRIE